jgi:hypothetical protein
LSVALRNDVFHIIKEIPRVDMTGVKGTYFFFLFFLFVGESLHIATMPVLLSPIRRLV